MSGVSRRISSLALRGARRVLSRGGRRHSWTVLGLYLALAILVTWPVAPKLSSVLAGFEGRDGWQYTWSLWWAKSALFERGASPANLALLNHPAGLDHPFQWSLIYVSLASLPFSLFLPPAAVFNVMVLLSFALSGLTAYWLCLELVCPHPESRNPERPNLLAAFIGGLVFAFASSRLGHVLAGWLPQMTVYWFPLFALRLLRVVRQPTRRNGVILGLVTAPALLVHVMHIAYFIFPLTLVVVGYALYRQRRAFFTVARLRALGIGFLIAAGASLPFLLPLLVGRAQGRLSYLYSGDVTGHSTDLLSFLTPSPYHPVLSRLGWVPGFARRAFPDQEWLRSNQAYPGLIAVGLAVWGVRCKAGLKAGRVALPWLILALGAAVLSLGPLLIVGREPLVYTVDDHAGYVVMPYSLVRLIPYYDLGRTPGRLNGTAMLGLGVLAAWGLADLLPRLRRRRHALMVTGLLSALILFEYLPLWPFPAGDATIPPVIRAIQDVPGDGALLHIPMARRRVNHRALYFQALTGRPIVGGEVHRPHPDTPPWYETIAALAEPSPDDDLIPRPDAGQRRAWLRRLGVDFVLYHKLEPEDAPRYRPAIETTLGAATWEDDTLAAWAVPQAAAPASSILYGLSRTGWLPPEPSEAGWGRWLVDEGAVYLYLDDETAREGRLRFGARAAVPFSVLQVSRNGELLDQFVVSDPLVQVSRSITLEPGMNVLRFRASGGCQLRVDHPACWGDEPQGAGWPCEPADVPVTCRSFLLQNVRFVEGDPGIKLFDVDLGEQVRLRGVSWDETPLRPGDVLTVTLHWQALVDLREDYTVFVHLLDGGGQLAVQHDAQPAGGQHPTSSWRAGEVFGELVVLSLPETITPGRYRLLAGMYRWPSVQRLDVPGDPDDVITLGEVEVGP